MDISVHVGKRKFFQIAEASINVSAYRNPDPQLTTVTINSLDTTEFALDGVAAGLTNITIFTEDASHVAQQPIYLTVTLLPSTAGFATSPQLGSGEVNAGTAFPP